jgi:hypothetical protein
MQHFTENLASAGFTSEYAFPAAAPISNAAGPPTLTRNADGRLEVFYRETATNPEAETGRVATYYTNTGGTWSGPVVLYGDLGAGPVAAITRSSGEIMLFERNVWHGISATWQLAPNSSFQLQWTILGGYLEEYPAGATDASGHTVLVVKRPDGRLYLSRESSASLGSFGPWTAVGS